MVSVGTFISLFQHSAARRRLCYHCLHADFKAVSTLSRPKAAAKQFSDCKRGYRCFNTQPPEGGWEKGINDYAIGKVSTLSRPKAAAPTALPKTNPK